MLNGPQGLLSVARRIGDRLSAQALWNGRRCSWDVFTGDRSKLPARVGDWTPANGALYQGTAGIGLFLAELYIATSEQRYLRASLGALAHAVRWADLEAPTPGFYSGTIGVAYALWRVGRITGRVDLLKGASGLIARIRGRASDYSEWDVIGGMAGAIPALLLMAGNGEATQTLAEQFGHNLLQGRRRWSTGSAWAGSHLSSYRDLTGFAHGAAGPMLALLELYACTGHCEFRVAAEDALDYEAATFSDGEQNWPDFRHVSLVEHVMAHGQHGLPELAASGRLPAYRERCATAWCHGAPGIGLSRLRGYQITGSPRMREEAKVAADTTLRSIDIQGNYSLCHGIAGNAETLSLATAILGDPRYEVEALRLAMDAAERIEGVRAPWSGGACGGIADPSLMMGEAGIGYWYLRLAHSSTPPILYIANDTQRLDEADRDPAAVARMERVDSWLGSSLRVVQTVDPTWAPLDVSQELRAVERMEVEVAARVAILTGEERSISEGVLALDSAKLVASCALQADLTAPALRLLAVRRPDDVDWTVASFMRVPAIAVIELRYEGLSGLVHGDQAITPIMPPSQLLVTHAAGTVVAVSVSTLAALVLDALSTPGSALDAARRIAHEHDFGTPPSAALIAKVTDQISAAYAAGLVSLQSGPVACPALPACHGN